MIRQAITKSSNKLENLSIQEQGVGSFDLNEFVEQLTNLENLPRSIVHPFNVDLSTENSFVSVYMSPFNIQKYYSTMMETSIILTVMDREVDIFKITDLEIYQIEGPTPIQNSDESPSEKSDNSCMQFALSN